MSSVISSAVFGGDGGQFCAQVLVAFQQRGESDHAVGDRPQRRPGRFGAGVAFGLFHSLAQRFLRVVFREPPTRRDQ
ncbi:hypothetical protein [Nocardia abscessus]|uniref:hypothetical protein n=1 Tax=Nocardia abscessus TaxID=120957 RepID=UPI002453987B|nr:hypothetical protein [Nocardia abscessus]